MYTAANSHSRQRPTQVERFILYGTAPMILHGSITSAKRPTSSTLLSTVLFPNPGSAHRCFFLSLSGPSESPFVVRDPIPTLPSSLLPPPLFSILTRPMLPRGVPAHFGAWAPQGPTVFFFGLLWLSDWLLAAGLLTAHLHPSLIGRPKLTLPTSFFHMANWLLSL